MIFHSEIVEKQIKDYILPEPFLRFQYDRRPLWKKITHLFISILREFDYSLYYIKERLFTKHPYFNCRDPFKWNEKSEGLYVPIHGLRGHPLIWNHHLDKLKKIQNIDLFIPYVPKAGNCPIEEAATPILEKILEYTKKHPTKPICLLGVSNGSRIAMWIETQLRIKAPHTPVMVSTIAGVHFGTSLVNILEKLKIAFIFLKHCMRKELAFGNPRACQILEEVIKPSKTIRRYEFWASVDDLQVPNLASSLPFINKEERCYVVNGYGHNSIVAGVWERQLKNCEQWRRGEFRS